MSNALNRIEKQTKFLMSSLIDFSIYFLHFLSASLLFRIGSLSATEHSDNGASFEKFSEQRPHLVGLTSDLSRPTFKKCLRETTGRSNI